MVGNAVIRNLPDKAWALVISQSAIWTFNSDEYCDNSFKSVHLKFEFVTNPEFGFIRIRYKATVYDTYNMNQKFSLVRNSSFVCWGKIFTSWTPWRVTVK